MNGLRFKKYKRTQVAEMRPYEPGESLDRAYSDEERTHPKLIRVRVSISDADREAGSPKLGDMIARNPKNHEDQWLVAAEYFADNFECIP